MSKDEKRIKIAEACGCRFWITEGDIYNGMFNPCWSEIPPYGSNTHKSGFWREVKSNEVVFGMLLNRIPDYFGDLNAIHEAESILTPEQRIKYAKELDYACSDMLSEPVPYSGEIVNWPQAFGMIHLTADERAESIGTTLGLWKSGE